MRAKRVDGNQKEIVKMLREAFYSVACTHVVGNDFPDLVIGKGGRTWLVELKDKKGKLSPGQERFREEWKGSEVIEARTIEDILKVTEG